MITEDEFLTRYPELNPLKDSGLIEQVLSESSQDCIPQIWLDKRPRAVMLLTAHILTVRFIQIGQIAGQAYSLTGGANATSEPLQSIEDELDTTTYGRQLKWMRSQLPTPVVNTISSAIFTF